MSPDALCKLGNDGLSSMPSLFNQIAVIATCFGLALILISKPLQSWVYKKDMK